MTNAQATSLTGWEEPINFQISLPIFLGFVLELSHQRGGEYLL